MKRQLYTQLTFLLRLAAMLLVAVMLISFNLSAAQAAGVVGNGTPGSCTNAAINNAIQGGGTVTFNCGPNPVTIPITNTIFYDGQTIANDLVIDGGNLVTLQGTTGNRIIHMRTWGFNASRTLTLLNMTLEGADITGSQEDANGAAIYVRNQSANFDTEVPTLIVAGVTFNENTSRQTSNAGNPYDYGGGAIYILGGVLRVSNSAFLGNTSQGGAGGAIHVLGSNLAVRGSTFTNNNATATSASSNNSGFAGAIYVDGTRATGGGSVDFINTTFTGNNAANQGGAAYVNLYPFRNSSWNIEGSRFVNNRVSGGAMGLGGALSGGATGSQGIPVNITSSYFNGNRVAGGNSGASGGAVAFAQAATITIGNSTFVNNRAEGVCLNCFNANGGAIYIVNQPVPFEIINTTIANNYAGWVGGGLTAADNPGGVLRNTIFSNNTADNGGNDWDIQQHCSAEYNGVNNIQFPGRNPNPNFFNEVECTGNVIVSPPLLTLDAGNGVMTPAESSPAVDAGNNSVCAAAPINNVDQLGNPRPVGAACDIGAVELETEPGVNVVPTNAVTLNEAGSQSRTYTITLATRPTAPVEIPVTTSSAECTITGSPVVLNANNYNTGDTVTVRARNDEIIDGNLPCNLWTLAPTSTDPVYGAFTANDTPNRLITIRDNDSAGMEITPEDSVRLNESGPESQTYTVTLTARPDAPVTMVITTSSNECTVSGSPVELTRANYRSGAQFTVTAVDDTVDDGNLACNIRTLDIQSADPNYDVLTASDSPNRLLTVIDDDETATVGITLSPTARQTLNEAGEESQTFRFRLQSQPSAPVTISVTTSSNECRVTGSPVVLNASNFSSGVTFTVTANNDSVDDGNLPCNVWTLDPTSNDPAYDALTAADTPNVLLTVIDDDEGGSAPARLLLNPTARQTLSESGPQSRTFTFTAGSQPSAPVTIPLATSSNQCTLSTEAVVINGSNWNTGVQFTVTAVNDSVADGNQACNLWTLNPQSNDPAYNALNAGDTPNVLITITDDDAALASASVEPEATEEAMLQLETAPVVVEEAPAQAAPAAVAAPVVEEAPAATEEPVVEEAPAAEPVVEEEPVPVVEAEPVDESEPVEAATEEPTP